MSEENENRWVWPFFLGFLLGVLVCLGGGGAYVVSLHRRVAMEAEMSRRAAEEARDREMEARMMAEMARHEAEVRLKKLAAEKAEKEKKEKE
jgi:hypothetical protein